MRARVHAQDRRASSASRAAGRAQSMARAVGRLARPRRAEATPFASARYRLALVNLLIVSAIVAMMAVAVFGWEARATDHQINDQLETWATQELTHDASIQVATDDDAGPPPLSHDQPDGEPLDHYEPSSPNIFSVLLDMQGHVIAAPDNVTTIGLPNLAAARPVLDGRQGSTLVTVGDDEHAYRLYTVPVHDEDEGGRVIGVLQAGISLRARSRQLHELLLILVGVGGGALALSGLASLFLADRALLPMRLAFARQRQFTAAASHELRTPLAVIRSQAEVIEHALQRVAASSVVEGGALATEESVGRMREDVSELLDETDYMTRLTRDLLLLARDTSDTRQVEWNMVSLPALVNETAARLTPQAQAHGLTLRVDARAEDEAVYVRGDADRLRQLVRALLENAIRYTPAGGMIEAKTRLARERRGPLRQRRVAQAIVADTGRGVAPEDAPRIFEAFYRAPSVRTGAEGHGGAGLGLAIAQWIVTAHGGSIRLASAVGKGSTFTVSLPLADENRERSG